MLHDLTRHAVAIRLAAQAIDAAQRGTGRTTRMLEDVRDGDLIICSRKERHYLRPLLAERGVHAEIRETVPLEFLRRREEINSGQRYTHFTHEFIQELIEFEVFEMVVRLEKKLNAVNEKEREARFERNKRAMMTNNPILQDLPFVPITDDIPLSSLSG